MSDELGAGIITQKSISESVNIDKINEIYLSNIDFFSKFNENNPDIYAEDLLNQLKNKNRLDFPINKHIELMVTKNQKNIKKIIKYIIFRYKFYIAGKKKINLGYPPYLLIEPVSTCNLR